MIIQNWGLIDYKEALDQQVKLVQDVLEEKCDETIIICHHPSVVTLGKKSEPSDITCWQGPVYEIQRGGRATYHGPGQVVCYPIISLAKRNNDIYKYLRSLESAMVKTLSTYGLIGRGNPDSTGVWINDSKIASIGVAIKRWITYHGLAINIFEDPLAFSGINPCGMSGSVMTSLEKILNEPPNRSEFEAILGQELVNLLTL